MDVQLQWKTCDGQAIKKVLRFANTLIEAEWKGARMRTHGMEIEPKFLSECYISIIPIGDWTQL